MVWVVINAWGMVVQFAGGGWAPPFFLHGPWSPTHVVDAETPDHLLQPSARCSIRLVARPRPTVLIRCPLPQDFTVP